MKKLKVKTHHMVYIYTDGAWRIGSLHKEGRKLMFYPVVLRGRPRKPVQVDCW